MAEDRATLGFISVAMTAGAACLLANGESWLCIFISGIAVFAGHVAIKANKP
jgi:hypothetical protein